MMSATTSGQLLRILSLNMQVGLETAHYRHYVTRAWRHVLPTAAARDNLTRIAALAGAYDLVALQEADAGSLRTGQLNQVRHLAQLAGFPHWKTGVTRDLRPFAHHCLGALSRWPMTAARYHPLPGTLPGRGTLSLRLHLDGHQPLHVLIAHLALTRRGRAGQLDYLASLVTPGEATLLLGDLNCGIDELAGHDGLHRARLRPLHDAHTFPSWAPARALDHLLATPELQVERVRVLDERLSDHLPVAGEIRLRLT